jgi:4-amino-4-deoxy-L-arabinose transferase-like glycosyltransferase
VTRPFFRLVSLMLLSEMPVTFAILLFIWAWLRWRRRHNPGWALLIGVAMGWAGITRPVDAICFALPVGIAMIFELRKSPRLLAGTVGMVVLGVLPFAAIQIVQNVGVTGRWTMPPEVYYHDQNFPGAALSFGPYDLNKRPEGSSTARRTFAISQLDGYRHHLFHEEIVNWYWTKFVELRFVTLPSALLVVLLPLGLWRMRDLPRIVVCAGLALFVIAYFVCVFHLYFYMVPPTPAVIILLLMGWEGLEKAWPEQRRRIRPFIFLTLLGLAAWQLPEINPRVRAVLPTGEKLKQIREACSQLTAPSIVLFPFDRSTTALDDYPVFNDDVAWPDDARVVRVNDLGEAEDRKLYAYYARIQPDRSVYVFAPSAENDSPPLKYLGTVGELAGR